MPVQTIQLRHIVPPRHQPRQSSLPVACSGYTGRELVGRRRTQAEHRLWLHVCVQAGSDSLLTCTTFFELCHSYFGPHTDLGDVEKYVGILYGLGADGEGEDHRPP
jgi:hypothetical protein